jgi:hypothetical protein
MPGRRDRNRVCKVYPPPRDEYATDNGGSMGPTRVRLPHRGTPQLYDAHMFRDRRLSPG